MLPINLAPTVTERFRNKETVRLFSDKEFEYYDAKATFHRDLATVLSIIAGFLSVALFTGNVDTSPSSANFVLHQHYLLIYPVPIFAGLVAFFGWRMVHWDKKRIASKNPGPKKWGK